MQREQINMDELDLQSQGVRHYSIRVEHSTKWGWHLIPLTVMVGAEAKAGEGLVVIGATHGNEYEGPMAIRRVMQELDVSRVAGRLIFMPIFNAPAFFSGTRDTVDDGLNLNRAFPGDAHGSITQRLADLMVTAIFPHVHAVFDLHSGGKVARFEPLSSFHHVEDEHQRQVMEVLARGFGCKLTMIYQNQTPGLLTSMAERLGKYTIGSEFGYGEAALPKGVAMAIRGIYFGAIHLGQLSGTPPPNVYCRPEEQVLADTSEPQSNCLASFVGHYEPLVDAGTLVQAGDPLGYLHDFYRLDEKPELILAPHEGYVVCQAWRAEVEQGQVIAQVGKTLAWTAPFSG